MRVIKIRLNVPLDGVGTLSGLRFNSRWSASGNVLTIHQSLRRDEYHTCVLRFWQSSP